MSVNAAKPDIHGEPYRDAGSPQIDLDARRSRHEAALDIALAALRRVASKNLGPIPMVRTAEEALDKISSIIPEAVP